MALKKWIVRSQDKSAISNVLKNVDVSPLSAALITNRGITTKEQIEKFFSNEYEFESPFAIKDMDKAVERLNTAIENFEKICIYGDYDCDGVTSVAILYTYLLSIGADVYYYIPKREGEGYGLNTSAIDALADDGTELIITVDNGISAIDEAEYIKEKGIDLIITDHHQPKDILPNAYAVVNPHRKDDESAFKDLAGVGVAFKLIAAMEDGDYLAVLDSFADLVAVGTVGDMVSLTGENRSIVKYGLNMIKNTENYGLLALMDVAGVDRAKVNSQNISFAIVPRINAAGRMKDAKLVLEMFLAESYEEAALMAKEIDELNESRQKVQESIFKQAITLLYSDKTRLNQRVILLRGENWHQGVLGIVAAKLLELTGKPVFIMSKADDKLKGSARSLEGFDVSEAFNACKESLLVYGGHSLAGGFSLDADKFDEFNEKILSYARENFDIMPQKKLFIEKEVDLSELTIKNIKELSYFEPFGTDNKTPVFMMKSVKIRSVFPLSNGKHQRITFELNGNTFQALYFSMPSQSFLYKMGDVVDIAFTADINTYNQKESVSIKIKDMRRSDLETDKLFAASAYFEKILNHEKVSKSILAYSAPSREECGALYTFIRKNGSALTSEDGLYLKFSNKDINYCKFKLILAILEQLSLIDSSYGKLNAIVPVQKTDLSLSKIYADLQNI